MKNGQGGDRILFRYPYSVIKKERQDKNAVQVGDGSDNAGCRSKYYRLPEQFLAEDILNETPKNNLTVGTLPEYPSKVLSNLFAGNNPNFCQASSKLHSCNFLLFQYTKGYVIRNLS